MPQPVFYEQPLSGADLPCSGKCCDSVFACNILKRRPTGTDGRVQNTGHSHSTQGCSSKSQTRGSHTGRGRSRRLPLGPLPGSPRFRPAPRLRRHPREEEKGWGHGERRGEGKSCPCPSGAGGLRCLGVSEAGAGSAGSRPPREEGGGRAAHPPAGTCPCPAPRLLPGRAACHPEPSRAEPSRAEPSRAVPLRQPQVSAALPARGPFAPGTTCGRAAPERRQGRAGGVAIPAAASCACWFWLLTKELRLCSGAGG